MRLEQLQFVIAVADYNSIRQAANQLYITPQNISKSIHQLEDELQTTIFSRTPSGMYLTSNGQVVYDTAQDILHRVDYLQNAFLVSCYAYDTTEVEGTLRLLCGAALNTILYRLQRILINRYPNIHINSSEYESGYIDNLLSSLTPDNFSSFPYDMVFVCSFKESDYFPCQLYDLFDIYFLKSEQTGLLLRQDDALARKESIPAKDIVHLPIIAFSSNAEPPTPLLSLNNSGYFIDPILTTNSIYTWEQYIKDGLAYGIVGNDYMFVRSPEYGKLTFVPLSESFTTSHFLLTKKKAALTPPEKKFLGIVTDHFFKTAKLLNEDLN